MWSNHLGRQFRGMCGKLTQSRVQHSGSRCVVLRFQHVAGFVGKIVQNPRVTDRDGLFNGGWLRCESFVVSCSDSKWATCPGSKHLQSEFTPFALLQCALSTLNGCGDGPCADVPVLAEALFSVIPHLSCVHAQSSGLLHAT